MYELRFKLPTDEFYQNDLYKEWQKYIKDLVKNLESKTYSIKTETFSNKFDFSSCICYKSEIPNKILDIFFKDFEVEAEGMTGFVVRELIQSPINIPTIYNGLPLNTEFRVFYDFDTHKVLYSCNYWDYNYCIDYLELTDKIIFEHEYKRINETFNNLQKIVERKVEDSMKNVDLKGQWSIDIMYNTEDFYLIDMAIAQQSTYWKRR